MAADVIAVVVGGGASGGATDVALLDGSVGSGSCNSAAIKAKRVAWMVACAER